MSMVVFLMIVRLTGEGVCVLVATSTLVLPSAKVSIVPERGSADPMGIDENTLKTINRARMAEREALACAGARVRGIGPADNIRGLCRLRRGGRKKFDIKQNEENAKTREMSLYLQYASENHKVTIVTIKITSLLVGSVQVAAW